MTREKYPLALGILSIVMTALGLCAAALGVMWGAAPPPGDALRYAWMYVNVMWMLLWLAVWPALALRPGGGLARLPQVGPSSEPSSEPRPLGSDRATMRSLSPELVAGALEGRRAVRAELPWQWAAILAGGIPAVAVAAFLSGFTWHMIAVMLPLQLGASLLALGVLAVHGRRPRVADGLAALLAALTVAGPVAAFLWTEFFPLAWRGWLWALPLVAVGRAAQPPAEVGGSSAMLMVWWIAGIHAVAGLLLFLAGGNRAGGPRKTPGSGLPGA